MSGATSKMPQPLRLTKYDEGAWSFDYPPHWEFLAYKLDKALAAERSGDDDEAVRIYLELIDICRDYIPALNNLALIFRKRGDVDGALASFEDAVNAGLSCRPDGFRVGVDLIPWYWEDNRPFLMAYENLGVTYLHKALQVLEQLHELNPGYRGIAEFIDRLIELAPYDE